MNKILPVILCGGSGTRLWPLSRSGFPKQFLVLSGTNSLFQQAIERVNGLAANDIQVGETLIVTNEEHRFLALDQLREMKAISATLLLEPVARNTAPALTLAALQATANGDDPILVVTPADQTVSNSAAFTSALQQAIRVAANGDIVILGITPDKPETGYGYIKVLSAEDASAPHRGVIPMPIHFKQTGSEAIQPVELTVDRFVEKPDASTAQRYLDAGGYYWNSGMFVLKASSWLKALQQFHPAIADATQQAWLNKANDLPFIRPNKEAFAQIPSESIDYAVMEPLSVQSEAIGSQSVGWVSTQHVGLKPDLPAATDQHVGLKPDLLKSAEAVASSTSDFVGRVSTRQDTSLPTLKMVPLNAGWNDLGAWDAVWQVGKQNENGNVITGDAIAIDTNNTLIHSSGRLVGTVGVDNLVIIETADAVLVADRSQSQDVKKIVNTLQQQAREEHALHRKVPRPWGWYDSIDEEERFKVKRIMVKPKASLSLQKHHHRAEHWIVVKGTAEVTCGDKTILLSENQSTYIPLGEVHRLANPGTIPLEIIEVQSGSYLGEDDIQRFEDHYGRGG